MTDDPLDGRRQQGALRATSRRGREATASESTRNRRLILSLWYVYYLICTLPLLFLFVFHSVAPLSDSLIVQGSSFRDAIYFVFSLVVALTRDSENLTK